MHSSCRHSDLEPPGTRILHLILHSCDKAARRCISFSCVCILHTHSRSLRVFSEVGRAVVAVVAPTPKVWAVVRLVVAAAAVVAVIVAHRRSWLK